jgi:ketosteroid isomerase-like protein
MSETAEQELMRVSAEWDRAMVGNDPEEIGRYMADDWTIIGTDGGVVDKAGFLDLVRSGALTHDVMESHDVRVRVYGDAAVVVARGVSGGQFRGQRFHFVERVSCVFVRTAGQWKCVSTHLSSISNKPAGP